MKRGRESKAIISAKGETEQFSGRTEVDKTHVGILMLKFFFLPFSLSSKEGKHFFSRLRSIHQTAEQENCVKKEKIFPEQWKFLKKYLYIFCLINYFFISIFIQNTCIFLLWWTEKSCEFPGKAAIRLFFSDWRSYLL